MVLINIVLQFLNTLQPNYKHPELLQEAQQKLENTQNHLEQQEKIKRKKRFLKQEQIQKEYEKRKNEQPHQEIQRQSTFNLQLQPQRLLEVEAAPIHERTQQLVYSQSPISYEPCIKNSYQLLNLQTSQQEQSNDNQLRKLLAYGCTLSYYYSKFSMDISYNHQNKDLKDYNINTQSFIEDILKIQSQIKTSKEQHEQEKISCLKVFDEIMKDAQEYIDIFAEFGIETIEPFLGFTGEINNLLNRKHDQSAIDNQYKDFRGIFLHGNQSDTVYCIWHGSCQNYDWKSNFDLQLTSPHKGFLDIMDKKYNMHAGFSNVFNETLTAEQSLENSDIPAQDFQQRLDNLLQNKKTLYISGHSLGAALATLSTVYYKAYYKEKQSNLKVKCWCFSAPRVFDKEACKLINQKLKQDGEYGDIIRQNVFMDPVTQSFESPLDFKKSIRLYFDLIQDIINEPIYKGFQRYLKDNKESFADNVAASFKSLFNGKLSELPHGFIVSSIVGIYIGNLMEASSFSQLLEKLINGSISKKPIWLYLDGVIKGEIIEKLVGYRVKKLLPELNCDKCYLIKDILRCLARLFDSTRQQYQQNKLEDLMFQPLIVLETQKIQLYKDYIELKQKGIFHGIKSKFCNIFRSSKTLEKEKQKKDNDSFEFGFYLLRNIFENLYSDTKLYQVWQQLLIEPTQASQYIWDYDDIGTTYLDVLQFDKLITNKTFDPKNRPILYYQIPEKFAKLNKYLVHYFAPLHYGNDNGSFNAKLTFQHTLKALKQHGKDYQQENGNCIIFEKCQAKNYELEKEQLRLSQQTVETKYTDKFTNSDQFVKNVWDEFQEYFKNKDFQKSKFIIEYDEPLEKQFQMKVNTEQKLQRLLPAGVDKFKKVEENIIHLGNYGRDRKIPCENVKCLQNNQIMKIHFLRNIECSHCQKISKKGPMLNCTNCYSQYCKNCRP